MSDANLDSTSKTPLPSDEVAEVCLLLPAWQVEALGQAAEAQGLTAGQLLRRLIAQALVNRAKQGYSLA